MKKVYNNVVDTIKGKRNDHLFEDHDNIDENGLLDANEREWRRAEEE